MKNVLDEYAYKPIVPIYNPEHNIFRNFLLKIRLLGLAVWTSIFNPLSLFSQATVYLICPHVFTTSPYQVRSALVNEI